jgi:hypothetical protein
VVPTFGLYPQITQIGLIECVYLWMSNLKFASAAKMLTASSRPRFDVMISSRLTIGPIVSYLPRNTQIDLRAFVEPGPYLEMSADDFSSLAHTGQAEVSGGLAADRFIINALSVIANGQTEQPLVISYLHCDSPSLGVSESIPQRLSRNAVGFVPHDGVKVARSVLYLHMDAGSMNR